MENNQQRSVGARVKHFLSNGIWDSSMTEKRGVKAFFVALLRIILTAVSGIVKKRVLVQAASLSYATLLSIGPILAITILFSGMFFKDKGPHFIYEKITDAAIFVMPALSEMMVSAEEMEESVVESERQQHASASVNVEISDSAVSVQEHALAPEGGKKKMSINPEVMKFIDKISTVSSSTGAVGIAAMLVTCLLLCINMESSMNFIWGARKGRRWVDRIVFYFAMIFFGSVGTVFGMTMLASSQLSSYVKDIPYISGYASWITYIVGMVVMVSVLAFLYKFLPTVRVKWHAAFIGAVITMLALMLNNKMSFIYISYIVKQQSFYGYLAIVAVAMFSLYIFWMVILLGGQIAYAVQYVDFLSNDEAWNKMGPKARELSALAVFAEICKSFYEGGTPPTVETLSTKLRLPNVVILACVEWLEAKNLVCPTESQTPGDDDVYLKPAVSPDSVTLAGFFDILKVNTDDEPMSAMLSQEEPAVAKALASMAEYSAAKIPSMTIREII